MTKRSPNAILLALLLGLLPTYAAPLQGPATAPASEATQAGPKPSAKKDESAKPEPKVDDSKSLRFAVIGDTGTGDANQYAVAKQMEAEYERSPFKLVIHVGDIVYGKGFGAIKELFDAPYKPLLDHDVKFRATLGNHDQKYAKELTGYDALGMGGKSFYKFKPEGDLVEFFTIDTTVVLGGRGEDQLAWLDKELGESKAQWKIVFFHHPPYSTGKRHGDDPKMIHQIVPILEKHGVQVVLSGHEHFFARLKPVNGVTYIISGSGGKIHRGGLQHDGRLVYGNDQVFQFLSVTLTSSSFTYSVIGANGKTLFQESIPYTSGAAKAATAGAR